MLPEIKPSIILSPWTQETQFRHQQMTVLLRSLAALAERFLILGPYLKMDLRLAYFYYQGLQTPSEILQRLSEISEDGEVPSHYIMVPTPHVNTVPIVWRVGWRTSLKGNVSDLGGASCMELMYDVCDGYTLHENIPVSSNDGSVGGMLVLEKLGLLEQAFYSLDFPVAVYDKGSRLIYSNRDT